MGITSKVSLTTDRDLAEPWCLRNTSSFIPPRYRKSRGTSHYTTQRNSKRRLCEGRDETINHIISECRKRAQKKYQARHDWVVKVIQSCKTSKSNLTNKWYMHKPGFIIHNEIQMDHLILTRKTDLQSINKKKKVLASEWILLFGLIIE